MTDKERAVIQAAENVFEKARGLLNCIWNEKSDTPTNSLCNDLQESLNAAYCVQGYTDFCRDADDNPWITDRRPTEDDAWICPYGYHWVHIYLTDMPMISALSDVADHPWQPVPASLRVKPDEPTCEECEWSGEKKVSNLITKTACWLIKWFNPKYGMGCCDFKRKG